MRMLGFSIMQTKNFQMSKLGSEKEEESEIKLPTFCWIVKKARGFRKTSTSISLIMLKHLTVWTITNCGKLSKRWAYQINLPLSWQTCMWVKKQQLEPCNWLVQDWERSTNKTVYCHPDYLYAEHIMWNARLNELQARIKIFRRNINHSYADDATIIA